MDNKKEKKKEINTIIYWGTSIVIPVGILLVAGLLTKDPTTLIFLIIIVGMYLYALKKIYPIVNIANELNDATEVVKDIKEYKKLANELNNDKFNIVNKLFKEYGKSLRRENITTENGGEEIQYYYTTDISYFFDEDNLIYKNIREKTITHITQALTGVGIFGTFMGIVKGVSELDMGNSEAMKSGIETLLQGVKVSFNTSLYGILFSVILVFVFKIVIDAAMDRAYKFCDTVNEIVPIYPEEIGFKEIKEELNYQTSIYEKVATDLAEEMGKKFDQSLQSNLESLSNNLGSLIEEMQQRFSSSITESTAQTAVTLTATIQPIMEKLEGAISNLQTKQDENTGKFMEEAVQSIKEAINVGTSGEVARLQESMDVISNKNAELIETFTTSMENMKALTMHQESLVKNTATSTETINTSTENMKMLQEDLSKVIVGLKDVSSTNNVSLENMQSTVEALKISMMKQSEINASLENMISKSHQLSSVQDNYINKFGNISELMSKNMNNVESYMRQINNDIANYKDYFDNIRKSTIEVATTLDSQYKGITDDLGDANDKLITTVDSINNNLVVKVNKMGNMLNNLVSDLSENQRKVSQLTSKLERFAEVEQSTQDLWTNYKGSFELLNSNINEGVENYTKLIAESVNNLFTEYDSKIAEAVTALKNVVEILNESAEDISESAEGISNSVEGIANSVRPLEKINDFTKVYR